MNTQRIEREREFHNSLADAGFDSRRLINRLSGSFYSKANHSPIWGPVWAQLNLGGKHVLDYGCGDGAFSFELARRGALVEGFDISESLVQLAISAVPEGIPKPNFSVRDAHATGFPPAFFDYVFGNGILHHLELEKAYREIARVLKPGGSAFFMEAMANHPLVMLIRKATPDARSVDEKPLTIDQIDLARAFFCRVQHTEHFLFAVLAAPVHFVSEKAARWSVRGLDRLDQGVFWLFPFARRLAWQSMLELTSAEQTLIR